MKLLLLIFFIPISNFISEPIWNNENDFRIENWELLLSDAEKIRIINDKNFNAFDEYFKVAKTTITEQIDKFHIGNFNDDDKLDFIYIGNFGTETISSQIFLGTDVNYEHLITVGEIQNLEYLDYKIPIIKSYTPPCCADYIHTITLDSPVSNSTYGKTKLYYFASGTVFPKEITITQKFSVQKTTYHLRTSPIIDNTDNGKYEPIGNIANSYSTGDTGIAFTSKTDDLGRVWWFVEMNNPPLKNGKHFPEEGSVFLGWMSSTYLTKK